jgi:hypothetical protein
MPDRIDMTDYELDPLDAWAQAVCAGILDPDDPQVTVDLQTLMGPMGAERAVTFTEAVMRAEERNLVCRNCNTNGLVAQNRPIVSHNEQKEKSDE